MTLTQLVRTCFPNFWLSESNINTNKMSENFGEFLTNHRSKSIKRSYPSTIKLWDIIVTCPTSKGLDVFLWPANLFAVNYSIIKYTDKYRKLVSFSSDKLDIDQNEVQALTEEWKEIGNIIFKSKVNTPKIKSYIDKIFSKNNMDKCIYELMNQPDFILPLFTITASIDECFSDFLNETKDNSLRTLLALKQSFSTSQNKNTSVSSILSDMHPMHGFVCTKKLSSQSGLTINSLTHNITLVPPIIKPNLVKFRNRSLRDISKYNILYIPYPFEISENCFREHSRINDSHGYFSFSHTPKDFQDDISKFLAAYENARMRVSNIDLVLLPECALSKSNFELLRDVFFINYGENSPNFLAGVWEDKKDQYGRSFTENAAILSYNHDPKKIEFDKHINSITQRKHHRWFLEREQIKTYLLARSLDSSTIWWENIDTPRRELSFAEIDDSFTLCPLICEDLARQEPVASAVRSVGPSLVVSLLLDGPQLQQRWPGKYAAVLADDPGSSVLSVSPLGMVNRSIGGGFKRTPCVALWSEKGQSKELYLEEGAFGILLELNLKDRLQWSLDNRTSVRRYPSLSNATSIYLNNAHLGDEDGNP